MPSSARPLPLGSTLFPYTTLFRSRARPVRYCCRSSSRGWTTWSTGPGTPSPGTWPASWSSTATSWSTARRSTSRRTGSPSTTSSRLDRKSTRLNSSHVESSYAVFCSPSAARLYPLSLHDALPISGKTGEVLLQILESRLDNVVYRAGYAQSRDMARQLVKHGHFVVNGKKVDIPSYRVTEHDIVEVRSEEHTSELQSRRELVCRLLLALCRSALPSFPTRRSSDLGQDR